MRPFRTRNPDSSSDESFVEAAPVELGRRKRLGIVLTLAALAVIISVVRLHTYNEPLERDVTTYAVVAHEMLEGKLLYTELWDHKPPAIHITYAVAELLAGYDRNAIFLLNVASAIASLLGFYFAGCALTQKRFGGLMAATIWTVVGGNLGLEANQPNTEVFLNAFLLWGVVLLIRLPSAHRLFAVAFTTGVLFALASFYKQIAAVPVGLLCLAHIITAGTGQRRRAIYQVAIIGSVGVMVWALIFGYFLLSARGDTFINTVFVYNRSYAGDFISNVVQSFRKLKLPLETQLIIGTLALLTLVGAVTGLMRGPRRLWVLLGAFMIATHLAVLLPGQFFAHYYQLWLPPLITGAAWCLSLVREMPGRGRFGARFAAIAVLGILTFLELPSYFLSPEAWSVRKYGRVFADSVPLASRLKSLLHDHETFYEWGNETGLYFMSQRHPVTRVFFAEPLLLGPLRQDLWGQVAADLKRAKPDIVILEFNTILRTPDAHPILRWVRQDYREISKQGLFLLLARKGSRLDRTLPRDIACLEPLPTISLAAASAP